MLVVDEAERWCLSNGRWIIRLDLYGGTLLGGPTLLEHRVQGLTSAQPKLSSIRELIRMEHNGRKQVTSHFREIRAQRWILELRTADALNANASQQEMARVFFGQTISEKKWRTESPSYRLRTQRLVRKARQHLSEPFSGPWFK